MPIVQPVPPQLLPGQRLTRDEFLRRWEALPELKNAELIDGLVYMPSPVSNRHSRFDALVHGWLIQYEAATPGCEAGCNGTWLMLESAPQPDSHLRLLPERGGQSREQGNYCAGAPELVVEICASTATHDFGPKLSLYQRAGVQEYLTVSLKPARITWRELVDGSYKPIRPGNDGILRSRVFPGLWLPSSALLDQDAAKILAVLREGLASAEHKAFAESLHR
ncbi:MAG: Uma2 family endonuclease [Bryobacteraceae bacterium]